MTMGVVGTSGVGGFTSVPVEEMGVLGEGGGIGRGSAAVAGDGSTGAANAAEGHAVKDARANITVWQRKCVFTSGAIPRTAS
jgi:hypothetical protein